MYVVVVNHEDQHALWPADREVPEGWRAEGFRGSEQECMDHVDQVWTDMRPLSLQREMAAESERP